MILRVNSLVCGCALLAIAASRTCFGGQIVADSYNLQELIDTSGSFTVGDKQFYAFSYDPVGDMHVDVRAGGEGFKIAAFGIDQLDADDAVRL